MYKVLIVDDEPFIPEGLKHLIQWEELGLEIVSVCYDGIEAMEYLTKHVVHILITDVSMPEMNGLELIRQVKKLNRNTKFVILSGYDKFDYVKEAVLLGIENYLLKPISENELISTLNNTIHKIDSELFRQMEFRQGQNILKDNILFRWMMGEIGKKDFLERAAFLALPLEISNFMAVIIKPLHPLHETHQLKISKRSLLQFAIHNICNEVISATRGAICFCDPSGDVVILYSDLPSGLNLDTIRKELARCMRQINALLGADLLIIAGSLEKSFETVPVSYKHAREIEDYRLIVKPNTILFYDELRSSAGEIKSKLKIDFIKFQEFISGNMRQEANQVVDEVYSRFRELNLADPKSIIEITMELLFHIKFTIRKLSPRSAILKEEFTNLVYGTMEKPTLEQLQLWVHNLLNEAIDFLTHNNKDISPLITKVINYMHRNYMDDLNLPMIAAMFHINPVYLGHLFKKETNELFTNYLNRIRIENAKQLLETSPDMKTAEIAEKVGYANPNYFYSTFKKMIGVTPTDYRREHSRL